VQLTGRESINRKLIGGSCALEPRSASYDLRIGKIIIDGVVHTSDVQIEPQQMFIIVSRETVSVPAGSVGYAMPKTGLCNKGILALNTGIIDPGYNGPLSTTAINFDKSPYLLGPGDAFLRVVFHTLHGEGSSTAVDKFDETGESYMRERRQDSIRFPRTFLDVPGQLEKLSGRILGNQQMLLIKILTIFTVIFGLWSFVLSSGVLQKPELAERVSQSEMRLKELDSLELHMRALEIGLRQKSLDGVEAIAREHAVKNSNQGRVHQ